MNTDTTDALALLQLTKLRSSIDNLDAIIIHTWQSALRRPRKSAS